ncbi:MAG: aromatic ring-hydroxylating dioxygenase subunit alpha [Arenicella sp.]|nr:aromatic ring-hydroxylating dioxygenase subunit alpha [Arenicella sp.]
MKASFYREQVERVVQMVKQNRGDESDHMDTMPVASLIDPQRLQLEQGMFRQLPLLIAHCSELQGAGNYVVRELDGRSWLLVRGKDGVARAFYNYCQHRGTKLVQDEKGCKNRFSCPYHSWTYSSSGELVGVPRADLFEGINKAEKGLKQVDLQEAHGFLWLTQDPQCVQPITNYFAGLNDDLEALNLGSYYVFFDKTRRLNANWKLPIFAFLESYHIGTLHRNSIADFFVENVALSEQFGPHIRSFVPRKNAVELAGVDLDQVNLSEYITPTNILFPNVCMISHPTSYSIISMFPGQTPGTSSWRHQLLVPEMPSTEAEHAHFAKTVAVLDGKTYEKEDFWVSEQIQEGINAGAISELTLGKNENLIKFFSDTVENYLPSNT